MENYQDIFQKACLIQLSTSHWSGQCILEDGVIERLGQNSDWLKGRKFLINPDLLGPIRTVLSQARTTIQKSSLPFPINSLYLIPKESLSEVDRRLQEHKSKFYEKVGEFEEVYEFAREEAKMNLGDLFEDTDYPGNIGGKFRFEWRFLMLHVPTRNKILPPEIYEREKDKFMTLVSEAKDLAMTALREEFGQIISHLVNRLSNNGGKPKTLNPAMFDRFHEFIEDLSTRNLFNDEKLVELCEQARTVIGKVSPFNFMNNGGLQQQITREMSTIKDAIDLAIEDIPRRKIRLAA